MYFGRQRFDSTWEPSRIRREIVCDGVPCTHVAVVDVDSIVPRLEKPLLIKKVHINVNTMRCSEACRVLMYVPGQAFRLHF